MAYTPKTWVCGETITAEDLNHLENGVADCCGAGGCTPLMLEPTVVKLEQCEDCVFECEIDGEVEERLLTLSDATIEQLLNAWIYIDESHEYMHIEDVREVQCIGIEPPLQDGLYLATDTNGFLCFGFDINFIVLPTNADIRCATHK